MMNKIKIPKHSKVEQTLQNTDKAIEEIKEFIKENSIDAADKAVISKEIDELINSAEKLRNTI